MALRAIPNLWYVRPADANETAMAWRIALEREGGPVAMALSRQKVPTLDRAEVAAAEGALRGAYTLWQSGDGEPDCILLATGSEVWVALEAATADGRDERSRRLDAVLGALRRAARRLPRRGAASGVAARLSVEAGISLGWERWVGDARRLARDRPLRRLGSGQRGAGALGFTPENVVEARDGAARAGRGGGGEDRRRLRAG